MLEFVYICLTKKKRTPKTDFEYDFGGIFIFIRL